MSFFTFISHCPRDFLLVNVAATLLLYIHSQNTEPCIFVGKEFREPHLCGCAAGHGKEAGAIPYQKIYTPGYSTVLN